METEFAFKAGQYITLKTMIDGAEVRRDYSLSSSPKSGDLTVTIKEIDEIARKMFRFRICESKFQGIVFSFKFVNSKFQGCGFSFKFVNSIFQISGFSFKCLK